MSVPVAYAGATCRGTLRQDVPGGARINARLTDDDVRALRKAHANGARTTDTAERFGITIQHVSRLAAGTSRADAGGPLTRRPRGVNSKQAAKCSTK